MKALIVTGDAHLVVKALIVTGDKVRIGDWLVGWIFDTAVGPELMAFPRVGRVGNTGYLSKQNTRRYIICRPDDEEAVA